MASPEGWRTRGYLPHIDLLDQRPQFLTWRLADAMPTALLQEWRDELKNAEDEVRKREMYRRAEQYLDSGQGECVLKEPRIGRIVVDALRFYHGVKYELTAYSVMPNHVHILITPGPDEPYWVAIKSIKSFTAKKINGLLGRTGRLWQAEYFDRFIRDKDHGIKVAKYIEWNAVKAGLCTDPKHWVNSSAGWPIES